MTAGPHSPPEISWPTLVGWSLFTIAIIWLALVYAGTDSIGAEGALQRYDPALAFADFFVGLLFTTPYIVIAVVCFGGFRRDGRREASAPGRLVLRSARNGFRVAVALAALPCALVVLFWGIVSSAAAGNLVYGVPEGAIVGIGITSLLLLAAGVVGSVLGAVWRLLRFTA